MCEIHYRKPRLRELVNGPNEIVLIQKRLISSSQLLLTKLLKRGPWVYDFDDAIWLPSEGSWSLWTKLRTRLRFNLIVAFSDQIHASSEYLGSFVPQAKLQVVPVSVPNASFVSREDVSSSSIIFGWSGKAASAYQLRNLVSSVGYQVFEDLQLIVLSGEDPNLPIKYEYWPYNSQNEELFYQAVDVGIVPSTSNLFDLGKTPVKALQHFSYGKTVISSPKGAATEFITPQTAILVSGSDWESAFKAIQSGAINLEELARSAFLLQRSRYSAEVTGGRIVEILRVLSKR